MSHNIFALESILRSVGATDEKNPFLKGFFGKVQVLHFRQCSINICHLLIIEEKVRKMIMTLKDAWEKFEKYARNKGYTETILTAYVLCNQHGERIKLISIRASDQKMVIWEDTTNYYELDLNYDLSN